MLDALFLTVLSWIWAGFAWIAGIIGIISCATWVLAQVAQKIYRPQNLRVKYKAEWALVTGSSSGIGKSIAEKLAEQGINVVLVALDDQLLANTFAELQKRFPRIQFRKVGVNLGATNDMEYMEPIIQSTRDISVNLVFNNAGFIIPGFFAETQVERMKVNYHCNATSAIMITHYFLNRMQSEKKKGYIAFTASAASYFPGPTAAVYSATKACLTTFAISLAGELRDTGIHIGCVHPSPVQSNFYTPQALQMQSLKTAQKAAVAPSVIADCLFATAGRLVIWDQGSTTAVFRLVMKTIDFAFFNELASRFAYLNPDHATLVAKSHLRKK